MLVTLIAVVAWIACGIGAYGITLGFFQNQWPEFAYEKRHTDRALARMTMMLGPIGLLMAYLLSGRIKYGVRFTVTTREESAIAHMAAYGYVPKDAA